MFAVARKDFREMDLHVHRKCLHLSAIPSVMITLTAKTSPVLLAACARRALMGTVSLAQILTNAVLQVVINVIKMQCAQIQKALTSAAVKKDL